MIGYIIMSQLIFPDIQSLIERFKQFCSSLGWISTGYDDWIRPTGDYHHWHHGLATPLFSKITRSQTVYIREGKHTAWIFKKRVPPEVFIEVVEDPDLQSHTAVFDLSPLYEGKRECSKVDQTKSAVFLNFEEFLEANYGVRFVELTPHLKGHLALRMFEV